MPHGRSCAVACERASAVNGDLLRRRVGRCHSLTCRVQYLPAYRGPFRVFALIHYDGAERKRSGIAFQLGAHIALPLSQVERIGLCQPYVPVDPGALVKPTVAKARVNANHNAVLRTHSEKIGNVEAERRVAIIVATDEAPVHEHEYVAKRPVELHRNPSAGVACRNVELAPVPPHACLGITPAQRLESMRQQRVVPNKRQLHRPVVGQVQRAPFRVVESHPRKLEVAGLGKVFLSISKAQVLGRVGSIAELKPPASIEKQLLAWANDSSPAGVGICSHKSRGARPTGTRQQR